MINFKTQAGYRISEGRLSEKTLYVIRQEPDGVVSYGKAHIQQADAACCIMILSDFEFLGLQSLVFRLL